MTWNPNFIRALGIAASTSALGLCLASPALAQDDTQKSADANKDTSDVIVVTAQFRAQNLQDTPLAITAVTGDQLEAKSQTDLATVADTAPNVQIRPQTAAYGPSVTASIRGIGQNDFNPAYEPGVGINIDDIYYPRVYVSQLRRKIEPDPTNPIYILTEHRVGYRFEKQSST